MLGLDEVAVSALVVRYSDQISGVMWYWLVGEEKLLIVLLELQDRSGEAGVIP